MLAQKNRLKRADFEHLFRNGNKSYNQFVNMRYIANKLDYCRFAVIVSNKISNKATVRNKIRRRVKAVLWENLSNFSRNIDIIITVLPAMAKADFSENREILLNLLKKNNLLV